MLENIYLKDVEKFYSEAAYTVWKFPMSPTAYEKQARPLILSYSIMSRAYGTAPGFNKDSFITFFNEEGFDVYLIDWGKAEPFTLSGWSLDMLADGLQKQINELLCTYNIRTLNIFAICMGGSILSYLMGRNPEMADKVHRLAYYGVPIIGTRDLGMERTFAAFYQQIMPYMDYLKPYGISLFGLDSLILNSVSMSMMQWTWSQYFQEQAEGSFQKMIAWTLDDRWVPYQALTDIINCGFVQPRHDWHIPKKDTIHFLNMVGKDDMLVKPSASIIEWNSPIPGQFHSFRQMIMDTDHFMFARPGFVKEKTYVAWWFAGYDFASLIYKLRTDRAAYQKFADRADVIVTTGILDGYRKCSEVEKPMLIAAMNNVLTSPQPLSKGEGQGWGDDVEDLATQMVEAVKTSEDAGFFDAVIAKVLPFVEKSERK